MSAETLTLSTDSTETDSTEDSSEVLADSHEQSTSSFDDMVSMLGEVSQKTYEETMNELEEHFGGRVFTYGSYSGTVRDLSKCPAFMRQVDGGFEAACDWLLAHDGQGVEEDEEETPTDDAEAGESEKATDTKETEKSTPPVEEKKPEPTAQVKSDEPTSIKTETPPVTSQTPVETVVSERSAGKEVVEVPSQPQSHEIRDESQQASAEATTEIFTQPMIPASDTQNEQPESVAPLTTEEVVSEYDASDTSDPVPVPIIETSVTTSPVESLDATDMVDIPRVTVEQVEVPPSQPLAEQPEQIEPIVFEDVQQDDVYDTEFKVEVGAADSIDEPETLVAEPELEFVSDPDPDSNVELQSVIYDSEETLPSTDTTLESVKDTVVRETVRIILDETMSDETETTMIEQVLASQATDIETESVLDDVIEELYEPQPLDEITLEFISDMVGDAPNEKVEDDSVAPVQIFQRAAVVAYRIDRLSAATTASECHEELNLLRVELINLLKLVGYTNPEQVAEELLHRYDVASLRKFMKSLIRTVTISQGVKVSSAHTRVESVMMNYQYGSRAVRMSVVLAA